MNKKFSTLVAVLLAAGVFSTVDAKVVTIKKGATPTGTSLAIGTDFSAATAVLSGQQTVGTGVADFSSTTTSRNFAQASHWKWVDNGGGKSLALLNENGDAVAYVKAGIATSAVLLTENIEDAALLEVSSAKLKIKSADVGLKVANNSVTWEEIGNATVLSVYTADASGVALADLNESAAFALAQGTASANLNAESFIVIAEYSPISYELKKEDGKELNADFSLFWTVEAVSATDAAEGFYLKANQSGTAWNGYYICAATGSGDALSLQATKAVAGKEAVAFKYAENGELVRVDDSKELNLESLTALAGSDGFDTNALDIAFWQAEIPDADKPAIPGDGDISIAEDGKTVNVDASTKEIKTPIYLQIAGKYLVVKDGAVEETTVVPTAKTAEAYSWIFENNRYTSLAASRAEKKAANLTLSAVGEKTKAATPTWVLSENGSSFSFTSEPTPALIVTGKEESKEYNSVVNTLSQIPNSPKETVLGQALVSSIDADTYYLLSAGTGFVSFDGTTLTVPTNDKTSDNVLWKVTETAIGADGACSYQFKNKAGKFLSLDGELFTVQNNGKYDKGFVLLNKGNKVVKSSDGVPSTTTGDAVTWGLYEAAPKAYTAAELNKFEGAGFSLTIDTKKDAKATIKGADMFAGKLTATGDANYRLQTADGKYIVLLQDKAENPTWGKGDLDGKHTYTRGYKFATVNKATDITDGKHLSYFRISHAAGSDSKDLIVEVMNGAATGATAFGRLYIAEVNGEYMLTTTDGKATNDVYPYVVAGNGNAITLKALVEGGRFVNISYVNSKKVTGEGGNLDRFGKVYTVGLNDDGKTMEVGYAKLGTEVLASSPETQWAISGADGAIIFANREQPTVKTEALALYATAIPDVYSIEKVNTANGVTFRDTIRLTYVENTKKFDGFMFAKENQLRNQRYNLSAVNKINEVTQQMYWAENTGTHKIGLDGDSENASKWKLSFDKKDLVVDDVTTKDALIDTVLVISNVSIIKDNKVVTVPDTLAILPYIFQNAANSEYVKFNDKSMEDGKFYICDKDKDIDAATRFALKMRPDSTYHFVTLNTERNSNNTEVADYANPFSDKLYGDRINNWLGNASNYSVAKGNDLMAVTPLDVPEYRQVAFGDTIRIYREENDSQVMYEKRDASVLVEGQAPSFLNIDNVNQFTKINPAIFVDTAYVNREAGENTRYQYLLAVNVEEKTDAICPLNPEHNTQAWRDEHNNGKPCPDAVKSHYLKGRFLINLMDTANVYEAKQLHSKNPYIDRNEAGEVLAKLAFVEGYHLNDTLFIQRGNGEYVKLELGAPEFNIAKFAFHYVNYAEGTFKIQTQIKNWKAGDLDVEDKVSNDGYLKWINGTVVVADGKEQGDVFNLNEDETRIPTANEGINASEVSVIAKEGAVVINGAAGKKVTISNVLGQTIANTVLSSDNATISAPAGIVVVAVEGEAAVKAIVK